MTGTDASQRKWSLKRTIGISILVILILAGFFLYRNFNKLLSEALLKSFNSNILSDVYELKFERLNVNPFEGSMRIHKMTLQPREKPLKSYPYINSSLRLSAEKLVLKNVGLFALLRSNVLEVVRISITKPEIELHLDGKNYVLFPFKDTTATTISGDGPQKKALDAFTLNEFELVNASVHVANSYKQREFNINQFNISLRNLLINQEPGKHIIALDDAEVSIGEFSGHLQKGPVEKMSVRDFMLNIDSLHIQNTVDTLIYHFNDFSTGLRALNIQTADSIFQIGVRSFDLSYAEKSIQLKGVDFHPNVSHAVLQKGNAYQKVDFSGSVGSIQIKELNFDSLLYSKKLFIDEILLDSVSASIFKDKTKPIDPMRFPPYLGQAIRKIPLPIMVRRTSVSNVHLILTELIPVNTYAKVNLTNGTVEVLNLTNLPTHEGLQMTAEAAVEDKAPFKATLNFDYNKPQFEFQARVRTFNLPDLNPVIEAYTPAKILKGVSDEITFTGLAEEKDASGTFNFLYHDLEVELELKDQARWKNAVISFAANSVVDASNPSDDDLPPRVVTFHTKRDMNKDFVNVVIMSLLNGLKETMIMSKENRKAYIKAKEKKAKEREKSR